MGQYHRVHDDPNVMTSHGSGIIMPGTLCSSTLVWGQTLWPQILLKTIEFWPKNLSITVQHDMGMILSHQGCCTVILLLGVGFHLTASWLLASRIP